MRDLRPGGRASASNTPKHSDKATLQWFNTKSLNVLERSGQNPDFSLIQNLRQDLKSAIHQQPSVQSDRAQVIFTKKKTSGSRCARLTDTKPKRFAAKTDSNKY